MRPTRRNPRRVRMRAARLSIAVVCCLALPGPAHSEDALVVVAATANTFIPGQDGIAELTVPSGRGLIFVNLEYPNEQPNHDLVHAAAVPAFRSDAIGPGQTAVVAGVETLPTGRYPFVCSIHPVFMRGRLTVLPPPP